MTAGRRAADLVVAGPEGVAELLTALAVRLRRHDWAERPGPIATLKTRA